MKPAFSNVTVPSLGAHSSLVTQCVAFLLAVASFLIFAVPLEAESLPAIEPKTIYLSGYTAEISGPPLQQRDGTLRYWHDAATTASWKVYVSESCNVEVKVLVAVDKDFAGSQFEVHLGDQVLAGQMADTGGWENYQEVSLGSVEVERGEHLVSINPKVLPKGVFGNLRAVRLVGTHLVHEDDRQAPDLNGPVKVYLTAKHRGSRLTQSSSLKPSKNISNDGIKVVIDPLQRFQTIEGFGGAFTESAGIVFSQLSVPKQEEVIRAYFDKDTGHGYRLCRTHINSCDFSRGNYAYTEVDGDTELEHFSIEKDREYLIPLIKRAQEAIGGERIKLLASPWSPPAWMKTTGEMTQGGKLKPEFRDVWARYYCRYIEEYSKEGIPIWGLTVQNEPDAVQRWESCIYSAEEERDFVRDFLGPTLHEHDLGQIKLIVWDHNRDQLFERAQTIFDDPAASRYVWGAGFHWYVSDDYHHAGMVTDFYPDKKLLFTEGCLEGGPQLNDWTAGERYARSILNDLNQGVVGWIDWNLMLNMQGGPNHVGNYCSAPIIVDTENDRLNYLSSYYYLGHFSRFVRPGAQRILCRNTGKELLSSAFVNQDGSIAIVLLNEQEYPLRYSLKMAGLQTESVIPERSINTLVIDAGLHTASAERN